MKLRTATAVTLALASTAHAEGNLSIYHWFEYTPEGLVDRFGAETGITETIDTYDSNKAMLATLKAGKMGSYDVAVPTDHMVHIPGNEGLLDTIAEGELANPANIESKWVDVPFDPGRALPIPYQWESALFSVNRDVYSGPLDSLSLTRGQDPLGQLWVRHFQGCAGKDVLARMCWQGCAGVRRCGGGHDIQGVLRLGARSVGKHRIRPLMPPQAHSSPLAIMPPKRCMTPSGPA